MLPVPLCSCTVLNGVICDAIRRDGRIDVVPTDNLIGVSLQPVTRFVAGNEVSMSRQPPAYIRLSIPTLS